ncbi:hypothetical protein CR513_25401, partial [Mucuna pruriens]
MIAVLPLKPLEPPYPKNYDPNTKSQLSGKQEVSSRSRSSYAMTRFLHPELPLLYKSWLSQHTGTTTPCHGGVTKSDRIYTLDSLRKKDPPVKARDAAMEPTKALVGGKKNLLLKILNEAYVAQDITVERFDSMINNITNGGHLTFSKEEVPAEGRRHNQPLHISVKCGDYMIARVLIDNGSSLNVLPKATLDKLRSINPQLRTS